MRHHRPKKAPQRRRFRYNTIGQAAFNGDGNCISRLVVEKGQDPNERDEYGDPPVVCAAREGHVDALRALWEAGADMSLVVDCSHCDFKHVPIDLYEVARLDHGFTAAHVAARYGRLDALKFLHHECACDMSYAVPTRYGYMGKLRGTTPLDVSQQRRTTDLHAEGGEMTDEQCDAVDRKFRDLNHKGRKHCAEFLHSIGA